MMVEVRIDKMSYARLWVYVAIAFVITLLYVPTGTESPSIQTLDTASIVSDPGDFGGEITVTDVSRLSQWIEFIGVLENEGEKVFPEFTYTVTLYGKADDDDDDNWKKISTTTQDVTITCQMKKNCTGIALAVVRDLEYESYKLSLNGSVTDDDAPVSGIDKFYMTAKWVDEDFTKYQAIVLYASLGVILVAVLGYAASAGVREKISIIIISIAVAYILMSDPALGLIFTGLDMVLAAKVEIFISGFGIGLAIWAKFYLLRYMADKDTTFGKLLDGSLAILMAGFKITIDLDNLSPTPIKGYTVPIIGFILVDLVLLIRGLALLIHNFRNKDRFLRRRWNKFFFSLLVYQLLEFAALLVLKYLGYEYAMNTLIYPISAGYVVLICTYFFPGRESHEELLDEESL